MNVEGHGPAPSTPSITSHQPVAWKIEAGRRKRFRKPGFGYGNDVIFAVGKMIFTEDVVVRERGGVEGAAF